MNEEENVQQLVLKDCKEVAKVGLRPEVELRRARSFEHQNKMSHFETHLVDVKSVFVRQQVVFVLVFVNVLSPLLFDNEVFLVDNEEEYEDQTACALHVPKDFY